MKTEKQIAEQYTKDLKKYEKPDGRWHIVNRTCHEHKFACQRFLEWLKKQRDCDNSCINLKNLRPKSKKLEEGYKTALKCQVEIYDKKITDLKQAIKEYDINGI